VSREGLPLDDPYAKGRFPAFDAVAQGENWDMATTSVVAARLGMPPDIRFFTRHEEATATALCDQLLAQHDDPRVPVVHLIDARLAEKQYDGWHYEDMPEDAAAWKQSLAGLDEDAHEAWNQPFHRCDDVQQRGLVQAVVDLQDAAWHGMVAKKVWGLWTRYACSAFYSHPWAWDEIGWPGPAYPRGYKNLGIDKLEPFEVHDHRPTDPTRIGLSKRGRHLHSRGDTS
jgi:hypothetical protein